MDARVKYIGPLSRLQIPDPTFASPYEVVAVLSGLEPQRTLLEQQIIERFEHTPQKVLLIRGKIKEPMTRIALGNITIVPYIDDKGLVQALLGAQRIIARSGYSTIMDLHHLGVLHKAEWHPTPEQPEQEYLAKRLIAKGYHPTVAIIG